MKHKKSFMLFLAVAVAGAGCKVEPEYYSQVTPSAFFDTQDKVYQRMARAFTHWAWAVANAGSRSDLFYLQEFTTDALINPSRGPAYDGGDWYDNGAYLTPYNHQFNTTMSGLNGAWRIFSMGVAQCWSAMEDIDKFVDFEALKFDNPQAARDGILMQLQTLAAYFYLQGLDMFGGLPLYTSNRDELKARSSAQETFDFIEGLLKEAIPKLPETSSAGYVNKATAAVLLARLYFNANVYIGKPMFEECAVICKGIKDGEYGNFELAASFQDIFGFNNENCKENIWSVPSQNAKRQVDVNYQYSLHYNMTGGYLDFPEQGAWNGFCLTPSLDLNGKSYRYGDSDASPNAFRLGSPFAKIEATDLRKQNYAYKGGGQYQGMFFSGRIVNPVSGRVSYVSGDKQYPTFGSGENMRIDSRTATELVMTNTKDTIEYTYRVLNMATGTEELVFNDTLVLVDRVAKICPVYAKKTQNPDGSFSIDTINKDYLSKGRIEGGRYAEENSGIRMMKWSPIPTQADKLMRFNPDIPVLRVAEVYYMLAECNMRGFGGSTQDAATLINTVRSRYFDGADPNPVTAGNLDEWRMLDEWLIEFLGEGRRRTDLVRWGKYTTEAWFDHPADNNPNKNRFPIPQEALSGNNLLEQNPGYQ
jgi:hypothetical protein